MHREIQALGQHIHSRKYPEMARDLHPPSHTQGNTYLHMCAHRHIPRLIQMQVDIPSQAPWNRYMRAHSETEMLLKSIETNSWNTILAILNQNLRSRPHIRTRYDPLRRHEISESLISDNMCKSEFSWNPQGALHKCSDQVLPEFAKLWVRPVR